MTISVQRVVFAPSPSRELLSRGHIRRIIQVVRPRPTLGISTRNSIELFVSLALRMVCKFEAKAEGERVASGPLYENTNCCMIADVPGIG